VASAGHLKDLLHIHQIQTVIDAGANIGQFGLSLRKVGFGGTILSFEPMRQARIKLEQVAAQHPPWKVFPAALGSRAEEKRLQIFKDDTFSSFHSISANGTRIFGSYVQAQDEQVAKIETLDRLFIGNMKEDINGPVLLKTDTQGHDLEVLQGGVEFLKKTSVVLTEAAVEVIYEGAPAFTELFHFLKQKGFEASGFYPFSHRPETLAMIEFDAFFVRKNNANG
jgi:FkbM family methyltransferase